MPVRTVSQKFIRPWWGKIFKELWADQQRLQISDLHFEKFPTPTTFTCWKIRFKNEVCTLFTISYGSYALDQRSPNFELLDARVASALNKIIQNTRFKKKVSLEEMKAHKEDRFLRGRQIAYLIYEYFRVTGANDSFENYADLFTAVLRNGFRNSIQNVRNSIIDDANPIWWHLGKLVQIENTRVWETQDRIGIVQYGHSSEESWTWLSQIEDNGKKEVSSRNWEGRVLRPETEILKQTRGQES